MKQRTLKVVLIGSENTGKTCLAQRLADGNLKPSKNLDGYVSNIGVNFKIATESETNTRLQIWDTSGQKRFHTVTCTYLHDMGIILIVVDPASIKDETHRLDEHIALAEQYKKNAQILYVIAKTDKTDELGITIDACKTAITQAVGYKAEENNILSFSSETATDEEKNTFLKDLISAAKEEAFAAEVFEPEKSSHAAVKQQRSTSYSTEPKPYFTGLRVFGFLILFAFLATAFLSLGGVIGGLEQIWSNIDLFFEAIQHATVTPWGAGVVVASVLLAIAITAYSMMIDYYRNEPRSEIPEQTVFGPDGLEAETLAQKSGHVRDPSQSKSPLAAPTELNDITEDSKDPVQKKSNSWCAQQ